MSSISSSRSARRGGVCESCHFDGPADIKGDKVIRFIQGLRDAGQSLPTVNHWIGAIKAFCLWLWKNGRISDNPLKALSRASGQGERKRVRRVLTGEEIGKLLTTAAGAGEFMSLPGAERALAYKTALLTGLRRGELRALLVRDLDFTFEPARLIVRAEVAKTGKEAVLPIQAGLAAELRAHCENKLPNAPVFKIPRWKAHQLIQHDPGLAGIAVANADGVIDWRALRISS